MACTYSRDFDFYFKHYQQFLVSGICAAIFDSTVQQEERTEK